LIGSVALACWPLPGGLLALIVEEVLGDGRVSAGGVWQGRRPGPGAGGRARYRIL